jgi:hypothetical protein
VIFTIPKFGQPGHYYCEVVGVRFFQVIEDFRTGERPAPVS